MGAGSPLEITYTLPGEIPAGDYHLTADAILSAMPEIRFDLFWRAPGQSDATLATFTHQYPAGNFAQYEETKRGERAAAKAGDFIVLRVTMLTNDMNAAWVPVAEHPSTPTSRMLTLDIP